MTSNTSNNAEQLTPQTPVLTVACRILRSPSHESVTTDLSLFSVSSVASDAASNNRKLLNFAHKSPNPSINDDVQFLRGPSPNPPHLSGRPADIPEILWFEEETEVIRNCAALSSAVGLQKSFSTSDITQLDTTNCCSINNQTVALRNAVSELALNSLQRSSGYLLLESARLDHTSRSCSTWVAVGDIASTSQLPSPHGGQQPPTNSTPPPPPPAFTAADFIRSVNKKVRQNYIRRRLLTTYKALERLSQSEFNLDRLDVGNCAQLTTSRLQVPGASPTSKQQQLPTTSVDGTTTSTSAAAANSTAILRVAKQRASGKNLPLTIRDVERERGKPLSKYERNMMIFNWLHTLDDTAFVEGIQ